jgi:hypothetical protein
MSDNEGSPSAMSPKEEKPKVDNIIHVVLKDQAGDNTTFKVKPTTRFEKLINVYAKQHGKAVETFRFFFEGQRIQKTDTPESLGMDDGNMVDVFLEQLGGFR